MNGLTSWKTAGEPGKSHGDTRDAPLQAGKTSRQGLRCLQQALQLATTASISESPTYQF